MDVSDESDALTRPIPLVLKITVFRTYDNVREEVLNALIRNASPATCFREKAGSSG
jgi:hypothetical protein